MRDKYPIERFWLRSGIIAAALMVTVACSGDGDSGSIGTANSVAGVSGSAPATGGAPNTPDAPSASPNSPPTDGATTAPVPPTLAPDPSSPAVAVPAPAPGPAAPVTAPPTTRGGLLADTGAGMVLRGEIDSLTANPASRFLFRAQVGTAGCDVELRQIEYQTIGGAGEPTQASAGVAIPFGDRPECSGARPLLLYAHGTTADRSYNILTSNEGFGGVLLAVFAARGFIVVAPDYTGYNKSPLPYHPYLVAEAQAADAIDALRAARTVLAKQTRVQELALFVAGFSQGGHVAMATHRAMERDFPNEFRLTASAPMSGPFALDATLTRVLAGDVSDGSNVILPFLIDGFQRSYGNVFNDPAELFAAPYDRTALGLFPGARSPDQVLAEGLLAPNLLPETGAPYLLRPEAVEAILANPQHPLRVATTRNSLLDWTPRAPMALCGGDRDPVVFYANTDAAAQAFTARGTRITRFNFDDQSTIPGGALSSSYLKFRALFLFDRDLASYHVALAPFCAALARDFFAEQLQ